MVLAGGIVPGPVLGGMHIAEGGRSVAPTRDAPPVLADAEGTAARPQVPPQRAGEADRPERAPAGGGAADQRGDG